MKRGVVCGILWVACLVMAGCASASLTDSRASSDLSAVERDQADQISNNAAKKYAAAAFKDAAAYAEVALSINPEDLLAHQVSAKLALRQDDMTLANRHLWHLSGDAVDSELIGLLGRAHFRQKDSIRAEPLLLKAIELDQTNTDAALTLAMLYRERGDTDAAQKYLDRAQQRGENSSIFSSEQALIFLATKRYDEAVQLFEAAYETDATKDVYDLSYRVALAKTGQINRAQDGLSSKQLSELFKTLGRMAVAERNQAEAVNYLKQSQTLAPKYDTETEQLLQDALRLDEGQD